MKGEEYIKTYTWMNALRGGVLRDVYALIYQIGQKGVVSISTDYICDRLGYSQRGVRNAIAELKKMGWLEVEYTDGKRSVFKALTPAQNAGVDPGTECTPAQNAPLHKMPPSPAQNAGVTHYISSDKTLDYSSSSPACARERLKNWIEESDLLTWIKMQFSRNGFSTLDIDMKAILDEFFDNDFRVRERCESGERTEVLTHFQSWLPKFLKRLREPQNIQNNGNYQSSNAQGAGFRAGAQRTTNLEDIARSIAAGFAAGAARRTTQ
jgi:hypothetical protein